MMEYDVVIVGGGPAGIISALTTKRYYQDKSVLLVKSVAEGVIPCGIPYMLHSLKRCEDNTMGVSPLEKADITVLDDVAIRIDATDHLLSLERSGSVRYGKLILATGSTPVIPSIPGAQLPGVYAIQKEMNYLKNLKEAMMQAMNVIIIGGGFIGVELADEISQNEGKRVTIVEFEQRLLAHSFDEEFSKKVEERLLAAGVQVKTGVMAKEIVGEGTVQGVLLSSNEQLQADLVLFGIGARPNGVLANEAGLCMGKNGAIVVDEYLKTSDPDIVAVGDCAEKKDFFTRRSASVMLASTATAEARIAGANLFAIKHLRENKGTIAAYSTMVGDLALGSAGLTEMSARASGFEVIIGVSAAPDKHPGALPSSRELAVKLVFHKESGTLLGGQVAGGVAAGEVTNIIAVAIQRSMTIFEMETLQLATHPKLTSAPTIYPLITAAQAAIGKM